MAIKKKRRVSIRIDMTPMVDIAFLLLIFYMATTQFKPPEARAITLPESHSQIELPDKGIISITITQEDSVYVDLVRRVLVIIDGEEVETMVRVVKRTDPYMVASEINRARARNPKALVVIKGDKQASFGTMQQIMKTMQENHLTRFLIITEKEIESEA